MNWPYLSVLFIGLAVVSGLQEQQGKSKGKPSNQQSQEGVESIAIEGYYACKGKESSGKVYDGVAMIARQENVYIVQWTIGVGSSFSGIGIRKGNTLAISWATADPQRGLIRGVNLYEIGGTAARPRLTGNWASLPGSGQLQSETLTFLRPIGGDV